MENSNSIFSDVELETMAIYSDFSHGLQKGWDRDIALSSNHRAVSRGILNVITTKIGDMPMNPEFGSNILTMLFRRMDPLTVNTAITDLTTRITKFERRVKSLDIKINPVYFDSGYDINFKIVFSIHTDPTLIPMEFTVSKDKI